MYVPTLQLAEKLLRDEQWKLLHIGRDQRRQIKKKGCDQTQHKGFLIDLVQIGAFSKDVLAWGHGAMSMNARHV